jgi:putative MATE family efflux protein
MDFVVNAVDRAVSNIRTNDSTNASTSRADDGRDLTTGPVWRKLLKLAGPMLFGIAAVISVQLVDTYFVGRLGTLPLAALSFSFPVVLTLTSLSIGLAAGAASVVSRALGSGRRDRARRLGTDALLLAAVLISALILVMLTLLEPLFGLLGAEGEVLDMAVAYMRLWLPSLLFLVIPMVSNAMVRADGDAFWPSFIMISSSVINAGATPVFVFGVGPVPAMGIEGAALGTLVARIAALVMALYLVVWRDRLVRFGWPGTKAFFASARRVLLIGLPAALGNASNQVCVAVATALIAVLGASTVAGFGVATRIEAFSILPMLALSSAIGPVVGQNWGAGRPDRVIRALKLAYGLCAAWSLLLAAAFLFAGRPAAALFASEADVAAEAARYLHIVPASLWGYGVAIVAAGAFNALGKPFSGLGYSLTRTALFYVPAVWIAARLDGSTTVYVGIALANLAAGSFVAVHSIVTLRRWLPADDRDTRRAEATPTAG